jgi:hypothetical protein
MTFSGIIMLSAIILLSLLTLLLLILYTVQSRRITRFQAEFKRYKGAVKWHFGLRDDQLADELDKRTEPWEWLEDWLDERFLWKSSAREYFYKKKELDARLENYVGRLEFEDRLEKMNQAVQHKASLAPPPPPPPTTHESVRELQKVTFQSFRLILAPLKELMPIVLGRHELYLNTQQRGLTEELDSYDGYSQEGLDRMTYDHSENVKAFERVEAMEKNGHFPSVSQLDSTEAKRRMDESRARLSDFQKHFRERPQAEERIRLELERVAAEIRKTRQIRKVFEELPEDINRLVQDFDEESDVLGPIRDMVERHSDRPMTIEPEELLEEDQAETQALQAKESAWSVDEYAPTQEMQTREFPAPPPIPRRDKR